MLRRPVYIACVFMFLMQARLTPASAGEIVVSAAASLTDAFQGIGRAYEQSSHGTKVRFIFGASGALQRQIEQGAPVDIFASAGVKEMDALEQSKRIDPETRTNFAGNRLVLIVPRNSVAKRWTDLKLPFIRRFAMSNPASVPSGRYALDTLTHRGLWADVHSKAVLGENVRQTLTYVTNGDVDAGIVFETDARRSGDRVCIIATAREGVDHAPIVYPAAIVTGTGQRSSARAFIGFLKTSMARKILIKNGRRCFFCSRH